MRSQSLSFIVGALFLCSVASIARAQQAYVPLEQRLSSEQMRATGLDQITPDQLSVLNTLLSEEQSVQAQALRKEVEQEKSRSGLLRRDREPIVSKLVGEFRGWSNGTRFQLGNGQTWRVIDTPEYYVPKSKFTAAPAVAVSPGLLGAWYIQVEGHSPRAKVQEVN